QAAHQRRRHLPQRRRDLATRHRRHRRNPRRMASHRTALPLGRLHEQALRPARPARLARRATRREDRVLTTRTTALSNTRTTSSYTTPRDAISTTCIPVMSAAMPPDALHSANAIAITSVTDTPAVLALMIDVS